MTTRPTTAYHLFLSLLEGQTAIANAEAMTLYSQSAVLNEIGTTCAPPAQNSIDHQRISFNLRDDAKGLLGL
jgi:hypothetical protein